MGETEESASETEANSENEKTRREFLKLAGLGAGAVVAARLIPDFLGSGGSEGNASALGKPPAPTTPTPYQDFTKDVRIKPDSGVTTDPLITAVPSLDIQTARGQTAEILKIQKRDLVNPDALLTALSMDKDGNLSLSGNMTVNGSVIASAIQGVVYAPHYSSLKSAIEALPTGVDRGGAVFVPGGTHPNSEAARIPSHVSILGANAGSTVLDFSTAPAMGPGLMIQPSIISPACYARNSIRDLTIKADGYNRLYGIVNDVATNEENVVSGYGGFWELWIERVFIKGFGYDGIHFSTIAGGTADGCIGKLTLRDVTLSSIGQVPLFVEGPTAGGCRANLYENVFCDTFGSNDLIPGMHLATHYGSHAVKCCSEGGGVGIYLDGWRSGRVDSMYSEGVETGLVLDGCRGVDVSGTFMFDVPKPFVLDGASFCTIRNSCLLYMPLGNPGDPGYVPPDVLQAAFTWKNKIQGCSAVNNELWTLMGAIRPSNPHLFESTVWGTPGIIEEVGEPDDAGAPHVGEVLRGRVHYKEVTRVNAETTPQLVLRSTSAAPTPGSEYGSAPGTIVWNNSDRKLYVYDGSSWKSVQLV